MIIVSMFAIFCAFLRMFCAFFSICVSTSAHFVCLFMFRLAHVCALSAHFFLNLCACVVHAMRMF